ncbi:iron uptake porin [Microcoleus sp. FACHB-68]|uniref:iron uptake porin n=1 Tax=Microcoleus sp. FACHB-68 TaxID=2692826 RepID=UPI001689DBE8|nr:iron uptake porin [Microcoleus sp. FACHB-68]MBD1937031.1 iron uptake porin [Microcoleus sp. FACHB-68]
MEKYFILNSLVITSTILSNALAGSTSAMAAEIEKVSVLKKIQTIKTLTTEREVTELFSNNELENLIPSDQTPAILEDSVLNDPIPLVSELSDVQPADWALQALQSLVERYGCIAGFPDNTYRGDQILRRYEFAAGLNDCLNTLSESLRNSIVEVSPEDLAKIERLQQDFTAELTALGGRIESLENRLAELEANQFSTTMVLNTSVVVVASDVTGDTADGDAGTTIESNLALNYRTRLNFITSFTGKDRLLVRLQSSNRVPNFNGSTGTNMTRQSFEVGNTDNNLTVNLLEYRVPVGDRLNFYLYGNAASHHYYTTVVNPYFASFGGAKGSPSRFSERNPIYRIGDITGGGMAAVYRFNQFVRFDLGYLANDANVPNAKQGLFNGTYSALAQLSFKPASNLEFGLTYVRNYSPAGNLSHRTGSTFSNIPFGAGVPLTSNSYGVAGLWRMNPQLSLSGWIGYTDAHRADGINGEANMINYAINLAFPDFLKVGAVGGLGFGMPPKVTRNTVTEREDPGTGFHLEAFYQYPLTDNLTVIPGIIYLINPEHNQTNGDIFIGTIRTIFNF